MSAAAVQTVGYDPLKDVRHKDARSARDQADWLAWLKLGGLAPRTRSDYEWATARLMRMFPDKNLGDFTDGDLLHCAATFPEAGRREKVEALKSWFKWAKRTRRIADNPMDYLPSIRRRPQKVIDVFTDAEIAALTSLSDNDGDLFLILFDCGLRRSEARNLQVRHVRFTDDGLGEILVIHGKGGKDRVVPMTDRLTSRLAKWFLLDALADDDYLWPLRPGGYELVRDRRMGDTSFSEWYRGCIKRAGVRYRNPHTTRHTFATRWLRRGGRLETLSRVLGHTSIRTTADLYAHLDTSDIARDLRLVEAQN